MGHARRRWPVTMGMVATSLALLSAPAAAQTDSRVDPCRTATLRCVNETLAQMNEEQDTLAGTCDHDAPFSLLYLRVTDQYAATVTGSPQFFRHTAWANLLDTRFADLYFDAYRNWHEGHPEAAPPAWQIAFDASANEKVHGLGNLLLGMNAHISNDLPFALERIGLGPGNHRPDYDKVNDILGAAYSPALAEAAAKFDPTIDDIDTPELHDFLFNMVVLMRSNAWWHARQLISAATPEAHAAVVQQIRQSAVDLANGIVLFTRYTNPADRDARDAYCAGANA